MTARRQYIQPRMSLSPPFSVDVPGQQKVSGETIPRRNVNFKDGLLATPCPEVTTLYENLLYSVKRYGKKDALGSRPLIKIHKDKKKVQAIVDGEETTIEKEWQFFELGEYSFLTYNEYHKLVLELGSGLRKLGLAKGSKVQLFGATSLHWLAVAYGCTSQSMPIVTAYDSLGLDGLKHSMRQTGTSAIYCDAKLVDSVASVLPDTPEIKHIIYDTQSSQPDQAVLEKLDKEFPHVSVRSFQELRSLGKDHQCDPVPPSPEDLACVMYTSGSTGPPKGVALKHSNVIAAIAGADATVNKCLGSDDILLAYLPQAHIFEFVFESACLYWGATMGYGNPKTLTSNSVRNCKGDIQELRPTILIGVPAVWETVKKGLLANVAKANLLVRSVFWASLRMKTMLLWYGIPGTHVLDSLIFRKVREATGGRIRIVLNGGGPISQDTLGLISRLLAPMINGYGLTETTAMGGLGDPLAWTDTAIGNIPPSIEVKLVDFPEAGYYSTNKSPQGEVWIRGPAVTSGYYKNEEETAEAYTSDGWFKTGDIGEFSPDGQIRVIDRKKNLIKTLTGEYIALEKLESIYRSAPIVANICVYAADDQAKPVAIIVPNEAVLLDLAKRLKVKDHHVETMVHNPKIISAVCSDLQHFGRAGKLQSFELVAGVVLAQEEWTPQNGFVTPAQKLQRRIILQRYRKDVDRAYGKK